MPREPAPFEAIEGTVDEWRAVGTVDSPSPLAARCVDGPFFQSLLAFTPPESGRPVFVNGDAASEHQTSLAVRRDCGDPATELACDVSQALVSGVSVDLMVEDDVTLTVVNRWVEPGTPDVLHALRSETSEAPVVRGVLCDLGRFDMGVSADFEDANGDVSSAVLTLLPTLPTPGPGPPGVKGNFTSRP